MAPNILLVVFDALRRDATEPYGAPAGSTPALTQLAQRGYALPYAYATSSWTLPSHASMFTGQLPRQLGLGQAPDGSPQGARRRLGQLAERMLPATLQRHGYRTEGFSANLWASGHAGFDLGFDAFTYSTPERGTAMLARGPRGQLAWGLAGLRARSDNGAADIRRSLTAAIGAWSGQPTFWFVNLCECHSPYLPPKPYNDLAPLDRIRGALDAKRHLNFLSICLAAAGRWEIPPRSRERLRHLYGRAVTYMDSWLADILGALDRRGILDDTLVIATSDHGESFGEDGHIAHGFSLDESQIHVPLILAGPGAAAIDRAVSLAELPSLVAQAAALADHPWERPAFPAGTAVAQHDPMGPASHPRIQEFAKRFELDEEAVQRLTAQITCATDGRRKVVIRDGEELLYDLERDPGEHAPVEADSAGPDFERLRTVLADPSLNAARAPADTAASPEASPADVELIEAQMKLLGYM